MGKFIAIAAVIFFTLVFIRLLIIFQDKIKFFSTGSDEGFKFSEINALWRLAKESSLEEPLSLFVSTPTLNNCISKLIMNAKKNGTENTYKFQAFLEKLYKLRTRQLLDNDKKRGLENSKYLSEGQKLTIILKGKGIFNSRILNNGRELVILMPRQLNKKTGKYIMIPAEEWEDQDISVYLWRKGDACYAFDSHVFSTGMFRSNPALFIRQSFNLERMQKRQSIRCECEIYAQMYIIRSEVVDYNLVETQPGYKCLLEDISQDGAMIRIGGKGENNARIKIQFDLNGSLIIMYGVIRAVEFNQKLNQSRLHFECTHISPAMKNSILTFIYNIIPQEEKDIHDAIEQIENESSENSEQDNDISELEDIDSLYQENEIHLSDQISDTASDLENQDNRE